ncbi:helix-turn-helix protein [Pseudovibrio sp. Ad13]|uniref:helix-turn-helix transcriptional regulator n=1 Tax=Pseudovibrio sp. Ad13 TaxID=989396 RepID=UPI0007B2F4E6|nr:helix-turn-helix transcriptional regulator [Pseudovibrio sp. Ad13]KZK83277.1 helix-turn-helix protein [Pseudovibrio sp. Ad13]
MEAFKLTSPDEILTALARRIQERRISADLTQKELAARSGVSYSSVRLLETNGKGSLLAAIKLAFALDAEDGFETLFKNKIPRSIEDVIDKPKRKRVRR